ncbi:MAG: YHS domain-containing protein [archaeon]
MAKDLICGMNVDEKTALKSQYKGKTHYFCSKHCKTSFDSNPAKCLRG